MLNISTIDGFAGRRWRRAPISEMRPGHCGAIAGAGLTLLVAVLTVMPSDGAAHVPAPERAEGKRERVILHLADAGMLNRCAGQAWGAESTDCLLAMARRSGKEGLERIRIVAPGKPSHDGPNMF